MKSVKTVTNAVLLSALLMSGAASAASCNGVKSLKPIQVDTLNRSYDYGNKQDLGYTLAAISWVESNAGIYLINLADPAFGPHQISIHSAIRRSGKRDTLMNRNVLAQSLLKIEVSAKYAMEELLFWRKARDGDWKEMIASYNAGWESANGAHYLKKVSEATDLLIQCKGYWKRG